MSCSVRVRTMTVVWSMVCLVCPPGTRAAEPVLRRPSVQDVALVADGTLRGSLLTAAGAPQAAREVVLQQGGEILGTAKTRADGSFEMRQVRPGVYQIATANSTHVYRVWANRMAPPAARPVATLVEGEPLVRGQQEWSPPRRALILGAVILTSGVVGGIIGYNVKDDDSAS